MIQLIGLDLVNVTLPRMFVRSVETSLISRRSASASDLDVTLSASQVESLITEANEIIITDGTTFAYGFRTHNERLVKAAHEALEVLESL